MSPTCRSRRVTAFRPDLDGNMAVFGAGGSGKSLFLRTLAVAAGLTARSGPCFVYGLDFGSRGLTMLERLPHVGSIIGSDDNERIVRLVHHLREIVDERAVRYAKVNAATLDEYRVRADRPDEQRYLLLVDGFGAFRNAYEVGPSMKVFEMLQSVAADGRPVGVHVVLSADRLGAVPSSVTSSVQRTWRFGWRTRWTTRWWEPPPTHSPRRRRPVEGSSTTTRCRWPSSAATRTSLAKRRRSANLPPR